MLKLKVNEIDVEVEEGLTVLQACEKAGVEIPRFCYHEKLFLFSTSFLKCLNKPCTGQAEPSPNAHIV